MFARIWEMHKRFIIGVVVALLFLLAAHQILVAPLNRAAAESQNDAADTEKSLKRLFAAEQPPTETALKRARTASSALKTQFDDVKKMVGFPVQAPFLLPAGEDMPEAYYVDVFSKTRREIEVAANNRAVAIDPRALAAQTSVERDKVPQALVALAVTRRALLTAVAAGILSIEAVNFDAGQRSAPIQDQRLAENLVAVTVRGPAHAVQEWMQSLGRRGSFLVIADAEIRGPDVDAGDNLVTAKVRVGPLTIETVEPAEEEEEW
jgi:hypothetical protein